MTNTVVIDLFLGDSGKGKIVDYLAQTHKAVVRFSGANNAGHTLSIDGREYKTHAIPSGVLYPHTTNYIAHGCTIDPFVLVDEISTFSNLNSEVYISGQAHVILPRHVRLDKMNEERFNIGSTKRGVAPAYAAKTGRYGMRYEDFFLERPQFSTAMEKRFLTDPFYSEQDYLNVYDTVRDKLIPHIIKDGVAFMHSLLDTGSVLFEGAQGCFLDVDVGDYPYVTSSNCTIGAVLTGTGANHKDLNEIVGVVKAYGSYVGTNVDFNDLEEELNDKLSSLGQEFGATTGRRRRLCWLELDKIKKAVRINGPTKLVVTRMDTLGQLPKICIRYKGELVEFEPWGDLSNVNSIENLPQSARNFISFIEQQTEVPVWAIGVGPERKDLLLK